MKSSMFYTAALLLLAGCTTDTQKEGGAEGRVPVSISVSGVPYNIYGTRTSDFFTRASTQIQKSQFDADEKFIVHFDSGVAPEDATFTTINGNGATVVAEGSEQPYFLEDATESVIHAYYPSTVNSSITQFTVQQDQRTADGFKASDLMYATTTAVKSGTSVTAALQFEHRLAKIVAMVTAGDSVRKIFSVRIVGGYRTISVPNGLTCELGHTYSDPNSQENYITMWDRQEGDTAVVCAAMLPPQDINDAFLEVVTDNGSYLSSLTKTLEGSHTYNLALTVGKAMKDTGTGGSGATYDPENLVYTSDILDIDPVTDIVTYNGEPQQPAVTVRDKTQSGLQLTANVDYQLVYINNVNAGTATVLAIGQGTYNGQVVSSTFTIGKAATTISYDVTGVQKTLIAGDFTNPLTNGGDGVVSYMSSNTSVATVNSMGKVTVNGVGTATITANAAEGSNYTYSVASAQYTVTVGEFTLSELKDWINEQNTSTRFYGYYVNASGNVHVGYASGDIGRVVYYSTRNVDEKVSGSRILVMALNDAGSHAWGSQGTLRQLTGDSGFGNTRQLQAYGSMMHPAAYAAWTYSSGRPEGASNWFIPSVVQWNAMLDAAKAAGTGAVGSTATYWTSVEDDAASASALTGAGVVKSTAKGTSCTVRTCFAY